jgi:hypothetical protein
MLEGYCLLILQGNLPHGLSKKLHHTKMTFSNIGYYSLVSPRNQGIKKFLNPDFSPSKMMIESTLVFSPMLGSSILPQNGESSCALTVFHNTCHMHDQLKQIFLSSSALVGLYTVSYHSLPGTIVRRCITHHGLS